jgi:hypothetical protein
MSGLSAIVWIRLSEIDMSVDLTLKTAYTMRGLLELFRPMFFIARDKSRIRGGKYGWTLFDTHINGEETDNYYLYTPNECVFVSPDSICYLDRYPEFNDNGEEVDSDFVVRNELQRLCSSETFENVLGSAIHQIANPSIEEFCLGLNHYFHTDCFIDFDEHRQKMLLLTKMTVVLNLMRFARQPQHEMEFLNKTS